jgi:glycogen debranching enzyme
MLVHGIGSISEIYEGDPPHRPDGAISQAWSVAELLRIKKLIEKTKNNK